MTWTALADFTTGRLVSASDWNKMMGASGNLAETAVAKATTAGQIPYATGANALAMLAAPTTGKILGESGGLPTWVASTGGAVLAKNSAQHSVATGASWTYLAMDGEDFDTGALHDTATNNSRLTAPVAGKYAVWATLSPEINKAWTINIFVNRTTDVAGGAYQVAAASMVTLFGVAQLAAGDYVEVAAQQSSGGTCILAKVGNTSPRFGMHWIGA